VPYTYFLIFGTYHAYILDVSLCLHLHCYIECNYFDKHDMMCTQRSIFLVQQLLYLFAAIKEDIITWKYQVRQNKP